MMSGFICHKRLRRALQGSALISALLFAPEAMAQDPAAPAAPPAVAPGQNTVITLIQQLVQEGVLTQERAQALIHQAQDEAAATSRAAVPAVAPGQTAPAAT